MAHDRDRFHPDRAPQLGQGHHHRPQHGLDDLDPVQGVLVVEDVEQVEVGERGQGLGAAGHGLGEGR